MKDLDKSTACSTPKCMSLLFHLAFAIPLAAQLFSLVKEAANPTELKTSMSKESLSSFEVFPLLGRLCVKPGLDVAKLTSYGYADPSNFYMGVSRFNDSVLGWSGHMENGSVFSIKDLTAELMRVKKLSDFMREIRIVHAKNKPPEILVGNIMDSLVSEAIIFFDRACFTLDYSLHFGLQTDFIFRNDTGLDNVLMHFKDKTYYTSRPIYEQKLNHQGATVTINLKDNMLRSFTSELKQEVFVEEDKSKDCTNYPNSDHSSYNECDQAYVRKKISAYIGPNFTPLWAATNGSDATEKAVLSAEEQKLYEEVCRLGQGYDISPCQLPCETTRTTTMMTLELGGRLPTIQVGFRDRMEVIKTDFVGFSLATFLANTGGSLGLWLGLGLLQLAQILVQQASNLACKIF